MPKNRDLERELQKTYKLFSNPDALAQVEREKAALEAELVQLKEGADEALVFSNLYGKVSVWYEGMDEPVVVAERRREGSGFGVHHLVYHNGRVFDFSGFNREGKGSLFDTLAGKPVARDDRAILSDAA